MMATGSARSAQGAQNATPATAMLRRKRRPQNGPGLQFNGAKVLLMPDMIAFVEGDLVEALPTRVVVSVNGLGYLVQVPLSSFNQLPPVNHRVRLLTHLVVREDAHQLYGFLTAQERDLFLLLLQ